MRWGLLVTLGLMVFSTSVQAQNAAKRIPGYRCMMLNITEQQSMDPAFHVSLKSAPSASAPEAGWAGSIVIVHEPVTPENGFLMMLKPNGQTAWIRADEVKAYRPAAEPNTHCIPEVLPNGRIVTGPG